MEYLGDLKKKIHVEELLTKLFQKIVNWNKN